ncbi:MAG: tetratricopeptide repeat protein [Bryobacteraceae bacterium]
MAKPRSSMYPRLPWLLPLVLIAAASSQIQDPALAAARSLAESGKLNDAEAAARGYLATNHASADGHFLLGYILFKKQQAKASLEEYTEGAKFRTPSAYDLEVVGGDYVLLHDYADADKWFTKSVEWNPRNFQALYYLGRTKYNENRFEEAVSVFLECLKLEPKNVKAEDNLGLSYQGLGRLDGAIAAFRAAIAWQTNAKQKDSGPYIDLGTLFVDNDRPREAIPHLLEAAALAPDDVRAHRELGKAYLHLDELDKAQAELERSVQLAPQYAPTHFMLAQVYRRRGMTDKAKQESERYIALAGAHSE